MMRPPLIRSRRTLRRGSTVVLTMIFLVLFATLAVAFSAASTMNLQQARNYSNLQAATMAAESGLNYLLATMESASISSKDAKDNLLLAVANNLAAAMDNTPNVVGSAGITFDGTTIRVPTIALSANGQTFSAIITQLADGTLSLSVSGNALAASRGARMSLAPVPGKSGAFNYGIASRSKIVLTGNAGVEGVNDASEANVLSATYSDPEAVKITGNCDIQGDISTSNPNSHVTLTGNPNIGGATGMDQIQKHIHIGVGNVDFPAVDPTVYEPYATNIVSAGTSTNGNKTFKNIRIKAGTNPNFSGNITLQGVVYIEQPNQVSFSGNLTLNGVIVTQDAGANMYNTDTINFSGNVSTAGVETLPDTSDFHAVRQMPGSMLLAPGFGVKFTGNFGTVNGVMAADKFIFTGNAGGTVDGGIICYSDSDFTLTGNSHLKIDRKKYTGTPPGFTQPSKLTAVASTYGEF